MNPPTDSSLFRWSKYVEPDQLDDWEARLIMAEVAYTAEMLVKRERWQLSSYHPTREEAEALKAQFGGGVTEIKPESWAPMAEPDAGVLLRIRDALIVTESDDASVIEELERENPDRHILSFPPQLAFGTGAHPTTAGCLRFLADFAVARKGEPFRVLDLGCGSGILAVAAAKLGASETIAVEIDEMALSYAERNAERHDTAEAIRFLEKDVLKLIHDDSLGSFDLIAANLFSDLLLELLPSFPKRLAEGGGIIVSGMLTSQVKDVSNAAELAGLPLKDFMRRGKWVAACG